MAFGSRTYSVGENPRFVYQLKTYGETSCSPTQVSDIEEITYTLSQVIRVMGNDGNETTVAGHEDVQIPLSAISSGFVAKPCIFEGSGQTAFEVNLDFCPANVPPCFPSVGRYLLRVRIRSVAGRTTVCEPIQIEVI